MQRRSTNCRPLTVGSAASDNSVQTMFKLTFKAVKVEINLWAVVAILHTLFGWLSS